MASRAGRRRIGGMTEKTGTYTDAAGRKVTYTYWQASREVPAHLLPAGRARMRITGNGSSKAEATERLEENWAAFIKQEPAKRGRTRPVSNEVRNLTIDALYSEWMAEVELTMSRQMARKYAAHFRLHVLPHVGAVRVRELTAQRLRMLIYDEVAGKTKADGSPLMTTSGLYNVYYALSACLTWALMNNHIDYQPLRAVKPPKRQRPQEDVDTAARQMGALLADLHKQGDPDYCRWLMQMLGLRRGERLGLRWSDITGLGTANATLHVNGQLMRDADTGAFYFAPTKTASGIRELLLVEPFLSALREHKARQDKYRRRKSWNPPPGFEDFVFLREDGDFIRHNQDNREWHRVLNEYGLPYMRGHLMRAITATRLASLQPAPPIATVRAILGHASDAMTLYYAKLTREQQRDPLTRYGEQLLTGRRR